MKHLRKIAISAVIVTLPLVASNPKNWETATVLSQSIQTLNAGIAAVPIGTAIVAAPLQKVYNTVIIQHGNYRVTWVETGKHPVVLVVNGTVQFYRDGNWVIVMDTQNKKHKFAVTSIVLSPPSN